MEIIEESPDGYDFDRLSQNYASSSLCDSGSEGEEDFTKTLLSVDLSEFNGADFNEAEFESDSNLLDIPDTCQINENTDNYFKQCAELKLKNELLANLVNNLRRRLKHSQKRLLAAETAPSTDRSTRHQCSDYACGERRNIIRGLQHELASVKAEKQSSLDRLSNEMLQIKNHISIAISRVKEDKTSATADKDETIYQLSTGIDKLNKNLELINLEKDSTVSSQAQNVNQNTILDVNSIRVVMNDHFTELLPRMKKIRSLPLHYQRNYINQYASYSLCDLGLKPWWHAESLNWRENLHVIQRAANLSLAELLNIQNISAWTPVALLGFKNPVENYLIRALMTLMKHKASPQDWPILRDLNLDPEIYIHPDVTNIDIENICSRRIDASISSATTIHLMVRLGEGGWYVTILQDYHVFKTWLISDSDSIMQTVITGVSLMINVVNNLIKGVVIIGIPDIINFDLPSLITSKTILTLMKDINIDTWFWFVDTNWRTTKKLSAFSLEITKALDTEESARLKIREKVNSLIQEIWTFERPFIYRFNPNLKPKIIKYHRIGGYTFKTFINVLTKLSVDFQRLPFCCNADFPGRSLDHFLDGCTVSYPVTEELRKRNDSWSLDTTKAGQRLIVETLGMLTTICDPFC
ncbi:uncharacterized protein LOC107363227 [Tetranychus urticae]|uniref:Uncharacterized protein n=1 Tax=Tetranychus urticae TaxID=32264 RepID=T1KDR4_TETUR|nr:uncharacterized protein LOC107363227 [Tetranychus urticae]